MLIGFLDADDAHHRAAVELVTGALDNADRLAMAASALAESLVAPARAGENAVRLVHHLVQRVPIDIVPLDIAIARAAAQLRAQHRSLRLPDALVIATAAHCRADSLVTTDRRWPSSTSLGLAAHLRHL